jgi:hypothetical protein
MKSLVRSLSIAGTVLMLASVQNASAQVVDPVEFTTAFPFAVGNTMVPAGRYTITPDDDNPAILELMGGQTSVLFETGSAESRQTPSKTEVVFKRYGDGYVLKDIWLEGSTDGAETIAVEGERHAAKHRGPEGEQRVAARKKLDTSKDR